MVKIITRQEVNDIVEGTFTTDLTKAVLYGEVSGDTHFVVSSENSVTHQNYTANQALLSDDIRIASQLQVTLTARGGEEVKSTGTSIIFDIITAGTATVGVPEYSILIATYDGGAPSSTSISSTGLTITFPANTSYTSKEIVARVRITSDGNHFDSNTEHINQNAAGLLQFSAATQNVHSTATTASQVYGTNCTDIGLYAQTGLTSSSITTSTRTVNMGFNMNSGSTSVSRVISISGRTPDGTVMYATHTANQSPAVATGLQFSYTGSSVGAGSGSTSDFTFVLTNASLTGVSVPAGCTGTTGGSATNPTLTFKYPANATSGPKTYMITANATDVYGSVISSSVTITQAALNASISITMGAGQVAATSTTNTFTYTLTDMIQSSIVWYQAGSSNMTGCTVDTTNRSGVASFAENGDYHSSKTITLALSGTSVAGTAVSGTANFTQSALDDNYSLSVSMSSSSVSSTGTSLIGTITYLNVSNIVWDQTHSSGINSLTIGTPSAGSIQCTAGFDMNPDTAGTRTKTVAVSGTSNGGEIVTAATQFTQDAGLVTSFSFSYSGSGNVGSGSGSTSAFTFSMQNVSLTSVSVPAGCSYTTGGTTSAPTITFTYPANTGETSVDYTITATTTDIYGRTLTSTATVTQNSDSYTFELSANDVDCGSTSNTVGITAVGVNNIGWDQASSSGITTCTISGQLATVTYPANATFDDKTLVVCLTGTTDAGTNVSATAEFTQTGVPSYLWIGTSGSTAATQNPDWYLTGISFALITNLTSGFTTATTQSDSWITGATVYGTNLIVYVEENTDPQSERTGTLTLSNGSFSVTATITQKVYAPFMYFYDGEHFFGENLNITVPKNPVYDEDYHRQYYLEYDYFVSSSGWVHTAYTASSSILGSFYGFYLWCQPSSPEKITATTESDEWITGITCNITPSVSSNSYITFNVPNQPYGFQYVTKLFDGGERTGIITVKNDETATGATMDVTITQEKSLTYTSFEIGVLSPVTAETLSIENIEGEEPETAFTYTIYVEEPKDFSVSVYSTDSGFTGTSVCDWITDVSFVSGSSTLSFSYDPSATPDPDDAYYATILLESGGTVYARLNITRERKHLFKFTDVEDGVIHDRREIDGNMVDFLEYVIVDGIDPTSVIVDYLTDYKSCYHSPWTGKDAIGATRTEYTLILSSSTITSKNITTPYEYTTGETLNRYADRYFTGTTSFDLSDSQNVGLNLPCGTYEILVYSVKGIWTLESKNPNTESFSVDPNAEMILVGKIVIDFLSRSEYLTFTINDVEDSDAASYIKLLAQASSKTIEYSKNGGQWTSTRFSSAGSTIDVTAGDVLRFRGDNANYGISNGSFCYFEPHNVFYDISGNIMSLIDSANFATATTLTGTYTFTGMFSGNIGATNKYLTSAKKLMLPATTLADGCYYWMFYGCINLTEGPAIIPATTLPDWSCLGMFTHCSSLTTAPELKATALGKYCCQNMFEDCTSLTTAPELLAPTLGQYSYTNMFKDCSSLNYIKCLATNISALASTDLWVSGVASTGTFVKDPSMTGWTTGINGIPTNWTVIDDDGS